MMKGDIKLFGLSSCSHCKSLRNFLMDSAVEFDWTYVDMLVGEERNRTMKELKAVNPSCSFPTLVVEGDVVVGFKKDKVRDLIAAYQRKQ
jgi:glutaredoxin-like protein NrdH